jgi:hypothetical protein
MRWRGELVGGNRLGLSPCWKPNKLHQNGVTHADASKLQPDHLSHL